MREHTPERDPEFSKASPEALLRELRAILAPDSLITDEELLRPYECDGLSAYRRLPLAVALPEDEAQVVAILAACHRAGVPIVPRGAGTGLSGGAAGIEGALTISFTRMNRILEIDHGNLTVSVQPGVVNADLKAAVAAEGLFYAPDPASYESCTIGGNLATNAGGLCCVKYGVTRDAVLDLEIVTAAGKIVRLGGKNVKDVAGYGLMPLIVGSQGTLALITEATLRLRAAPAPRTTLLAFFPTVDAAGDAVAAMTAGGLVPVTLELMDQFTVRAVDDVHHLGLDRDAAAMLLVESDLPGPAGLAEMEAAEAACQAAGASMVLRAADPVEADWLRQGRRLAYRALEAIGAARMEDIGVPRSRIPEMLRAIGDVAAAHNVTIGTFGHAGDGNLHPTFVVGPGEPEAVALERITAAKAALYEAVLALGGTVTAEHGIGASRQAWLLRQRGEDAVAMMRAIKRALDPDNLLNPGRVLG